MAAGPAATPALSTGPAVVEIHRSAGRDRTASRTATDWVTYADHLLVVTVVGETRHEPSRSEIDRGEGMIGRTARLRVDEVLWSAPDAPQPAPADLSLSVAGWMFNTNDGGRTDAVEFALRDSSRLEPGHTYAKALEWIDDPCSNDPRKGDWEGLGSGDTIPFDGGVLGAGEFEGQVQTLAEAKAKWDTDQPGAPAVRFQMAGRSADDLVAGLTTTPPRTEQGYGPRECNPSDR